MQRNRKNVNKQEVNKATTGSYSYKLLFVILQHGYGEEIKDLLKEYGVAFTMLLAGEGTANSQIRHLLSLGDSRKDVLLALIESDKSKELIAHIKEAYQYHGVAFAVKLGSLGSRNLLNYLRGEKNNGSKK